MQPEFRLYAVKIFAVCSIVFFVQNFYGSFTDLFSLDSSMVFQRPWTLFTYMFLHADLQHFISNMFALLVFGLILEKTIGSENFLKVYFLAGVSSGLIGSFFYASVLGASGAIFGAMASLALLRPSLTVWVGYIPMPMIIALFVWAASDMLGLFIPSNVANSGHLAGMLFGALYTLAYLGKFREQPAKKYRIHISEETIREWEKRYM
ncbi:MAG: rhomboid family intramembrane serine protease [Candidatus Aenigmarchaeota archaeon]|nr:rhomboid family intramembrane serine protease [Candidatus Aenigmarchaeota archaeon]